MFLIKRYFNAISAISGTISAIFNAINAIFNIVGVNHGAICINLPPININTQINFTTNKLWLSQSSRFYSINNSWNAASPMLDQVT